MGAAATIAATIAATVKVRVELFGTCRLYGGVREVELSLPPEAGIEDVTRALAGACPALAGRALRDDLAGLQDGYVFNRNGIAFLSGRSGDRISLESGDSLLLLSNQAGG